MRLDFAPRLALAFIVTAGMAACAKEVRAPKPSPPSTPPSAPLAPMQRVIPLPSSVEPATGDGFAFTEATTILTPAGNQEVNRIGQYLSVLIGTAAGKTPPRVDQAGAAPPAGAVQLVLGALPGAGEDGYELVISPERVTITAANPAGIFYGVQTLRQLLPPTIEYEAAVAEKSRPIVVPPGRIVDRPRFVWRGAMLDVARHFFDVDDVKRYVDLLALYKFNRLHLHLSDDQGWRLDIKSWPNLARHGGSTAVGGGPGGYYTQEAYTGLVKYAQDRFITIVPEIDMPGHTNAALASYPELNCNGVAPSLYTGIEVGFSTFCIDKDITYKFIDDVVREISAITAGPYFHVGGDEVEKLTPAQYKQFIERVQDIVQKHGKQMIGWDEIAPVNLLPTSIVQHWRPKANEGLAKAPRLIVSPANRAYLDMKYDKQTALGLNWAGYVDTRTAYSWDPAEVVKGVAEGAILGVEAPLWSETVVYMHDVEYMAFPRLAAIAEIGWSAAKQRQWDDFARRLGAQAPRWAALGVNFFRTSDVVWER